MFDFQQEQDEREPQPIECSAPARFTEALAAAWAEPITLLFGWLNSWRHGDFWGTRDAMFFIPLSNDYTGGYILAVLRHNGIDVYDFGATFDRHQLVVDQNDYYRVIAAFDAAGIIYQAEDISQ